MNRSITLAIAAGMSLACGLLLWPISAKADLVSIGLAEDTFVLPSTLTSGSGSASTGTIIFGDYSVQAAGTGTPPLTEPQFDSNTIDVQETGSGTHTLLVYVTEQGLSSPTGIANFLSSFTSNTQSANTVLLKTMISTTNALFTGSNLDSQTFNASAGNQTGSSEDLTPSLSSPYSLTALFEITTTGSGQSANLTIDISSLPEPASMALLGIALLGFGVIRRRNYHRA